MYVCLEIPSDIECYDYFNFHEDFTTHNYIQAGSVGSAPACFGSYIKRYGSTVCRNNSLTLYAYTSVTMQVPKNLVNLQVEYCIFQTFCKISKFLIFFEISSSQIRKKQFQIWQYRLSTGGNRTSYVFDNGEIEGFLGTGNTLNTSIFSKNMSLAHVH